MVIQDKELRQDLLGWMDEALWQHETIQAAAAAVVDRVIAEGALETFVREFGPGAVEALWWENNRKQREAAMAPGTPGPRKMQVESLKQQASALEVLYPLGDGRAFRLGDMGIEECRLLQRRFHKSAEGHLREAYMFSKLADGLKKGQLVREKFTGDQVRGLLAAFRLE